MVCFKKMSVCRVENPELAEINSRLQVRSFVEIKTKSTTISAGGEQSGHS